MQMSLKLRIVAWVLGDNGPSSSIRRTTRRNALQLRLFIDRFLVASAQLYKRVRPSVGPSVRPSVRPSVG